MPAFLRSKLNWHPRVRFTLSDSSWAPDRCLGCQRMAPSYSKLVAPYCNTPLPKSAVPCCPLTPPWQEGMRVVGSVNRTPSWTGARRQRQVALGPPDGVGRGDSASRPYPGESLPGQVAGPLVVTQDWGTSEHYR